MQATAALCQHPPGARGPWGGHACCPPSTRALTPRLSPRRRKSGGGKSLGSNPSSTALGEAAPLRCPTRGEEGHSGGEGDRPWGRPQAPTPPSNHRPLKIQRMKLENRCRRGCVDQRLLVPGSHANTRGRWPRGQGLGRLGLSGSSLPTQGSSDIWRGVGSAAAELAEA